MQIQQLCQGLRLVSPVEKAARLLKRTLAKVTDVLLSGASRKWPNKPYYYNKRLPVTAWNIALQNTAVSHDPDLEKKLDYLREVFESEEPVIRELKST